MVRQAKTPDQTTARARLRQKSPIRHFNLYGEGDAAAGPGWSAENWTNSYHFEHIPVRSGRFNWEIEPHVHDAFLQLLLLTRGSAKVVVNGQVQQVQAPALVLIPAQNVHGFHFSSDTDGPVVTAAQAPLASALRLLMPAMQSVLARPAVIALQPQTPVLEALTTLFAAVEQEWRVHHAGHAAAGQALLTALLVHVARLSPPGPVAGQAAGKMAGQLAPTRPTASVDRFKALVNDKFRTHLAVEAYASRLGMSAGQLTRLTQRVLGMSAQGVINARLMFEAERDLIYTFDSVQQIAANLGFADAAYFSRFFRKHNGRTPRAFRAEGLARMRPLTAGLGSNGAA